MEVCVKQLTTGKNKNYNMKKILLLLVVMLSLNVFSQEITQIKGRYFVNGKQISTRETTALLAANTEASALFKSAKTKESIGGFLVGFGSALVAIDVVVGLVSDVQYPTTATYVGLASIITSIPILSGRNKKREKAIGLYNDGLKSSGNQDSNPELNIIANQNGYGLQFRF